MGIIDKYAKKYLSDPERFADAFNFYLYRGRKIILPGNLQKLDTAALVLPYDKGRKHKSSKALYRDILQLYTAMRDDNATYLILGLEEQSHIRYAMPIRNMLYDAMAYADQVNELSRLNRANSDWDSEDEYLSGLHKSDRLKPVITLVISLSDKSWDAPTTLHDMLDVADDSLWQFIPNYRLNIITLQQIAEADFDKFHTELGTVLQFVKHHNDSTNDWMIGNRRFEQVSRDTANLINATVGMTIDLPKGKEDVNMVWVAYENTKKRYREAWLKEGREEGRKEGRKEGHEEGRIATLLTAARNMVTNFDVAPEKAFDMLQATADERKALLPRL